MADRQVLPCSYCGTGRPCSEDFYLRFVGRTVTRWCETCRRSFDVDIPPSKIAPLPPKIQPPSS